MVIIRRFGRFTKPQGLRVPGHLGNAIGRRCLAWFFLAWGIGLRNHLRPAPGAWAPGIRNRSPDAFSGTSGIRGSFETATFGTCISDVHLVTFPSCINVKGSPFSIMWRDAPLSTMTSRFLFSQSDRGATTSSCVVVFGGRKNLFMPGHKFL